ncbi:MAG: hypothetical protein ACRYFX_12680 [Janthinobacterium lividum]
MAQLNSVKQTWDEYKGWAIVGLIIAIIVNFWGFFKSLGDAAKSGADATLGGLKQDAEDKAAKAKAKAASGGKINFSTDQTNRFRQDAEALANYLGRGEGFGMVDVIKDQASAFSLIKQHYSRLNLYQNKPCRWADASKQKIVSQTAETAASIKNAINWRVLVPFYKEASKGHDLNADFRYYVTGSGYTKYFKWIL